MMLALTLLLAVPFTAADMLDIQSFARGQPVALSRDGAYVAYVLTDIDDENNILERRPTGDIHVMRIGEVAVPLTSGAASSAYPVWSPDGMRLAFFCFEDDGGALALWDRRTGETRMLGERFTGKAYLPPRWDREGRRIVYAAAVRESPTPPPRRIQVIRSDDARIPGDAFFLDRRQARLVAIKTGHTERGIQSELSPSVRLRAFTIMPDGDRVSFSAVTEESFGLIGRQQQEVYIVPLDGSEEPRPMPRDELEALGRTRFRSPDGRHLVSLVPDPGVQDPEIGPVKEGMYTIARSSMDLYLEATEDGATRNLTGGFEDHVLDPVWSPEGDSLYFRSVDHESYEETLYRYLVAGEGRLEVLTSGPESYGNLSASASRVTFTRESATRPEELYQIDLETGERSRLTDLNPQLDVFAFSTPEMFAFENADGESLGALLFKPTVATSDEGVPVITFVYEKLTPSVHRFQPRHQIFITHGYAVLMPNVKVIVGETATSFLKSVVPAVAAVRAMGFTNDKFCLWGGSFGAYATSYVITQTNIFECAVSRATPPELFRNWASGRDRDSNNIERGQARMGGSPFKVQDRYLSQSAFFHLDKVETPVLLTHGIKDKTILVGEGEMMFYALRRLGKEAELVLYAEGDHSLYRHSRADAIDVHERMLAWFERYLK